MSEQETLALAEVERSMSGDTGRSLYRRINLSIDEIVDRVSRHHSIQARGAKRLSVQAMHAIITMLTREAERYKGCIVLPLKHRAAAKWWEVSVGDVNIINSRNALFESYEIRHNKAITSKFVQSLCENLPKASITRLYILTTYPQKDFYSLEPDIRKIAQVHRREVIVDRVDQTLTHYLRLIKDPSKFLGRYLSNVETDPLITFQLKEAWNEIVRA